MSQNTYTYESTTGRLQKVGDGGATEYSATYTYLPNSTMVGTLTFKQGTTTRLTTTRQYDYLHRLASITSTPVGTSSTSSLTYSYAYNSANQRTRMTLADGSYWLYLYDDKGQVISGKRYWNDHTPVPGQQNEYTFDDIGNRTQTKSGGDNNGSGASLRTANYTRNLLNQYTQRDVPAAFDVLGLATSTASVTINGSAADYRRGEYFQEAVTASNASAPDWKNVSVTTSGGGSSSGNVFVPKTPEPYTYDLDGNTLTDGRWTYTWNAENHLITLVGHTGLSTVLRLEFEHDTLAAWHLK